MADDLQARLESHSKAFEGLMSLIPAQYYYGQDNSDQWQRKKQTKEEKRTAKRAKLDPANNQSALDVHKENERKRKRELGLTNGDEGGDDDGDGDDLGDDTQQNREKPMEGLKNAKKQSKKQKTDTPGSGSVADAESRQKQVADKRREARERKKAKKDKAREKKEASKARKSGQKQNAASDGGAAVIDDSPEQPHNDQADEDDGEVGEDAGGEQMDRLDFSGLAAEADDDAGSVSSEVSSASASPIFDRDNSTSHSSASSSTSIIPSTDSASATTASHQTKDKATPSSTVKSDAPPADADKSTALAVSDTSKTSKLPSIDPSVLQARLAARLEALRAARKADGLNGKPAKNRQELIEARRRKEEQRRAHKKELRAKARIQKDAEAEAARLRGGSGSPLWSPAVQSPKQENSFDFGRVAFDDGAELDSSLQGIVEPRRKKGPSDTKTALEAAQKKKARISGLDSEKRAEIEEKDRWLAAKKRVHGEKLRDDASLLKKTLKREEKQKGRSEKAWNERIESVKHGQEMRQKKREENLQKRRDGKGAGRKGAKKVAGKPKPKPKPKGRPGFEGSFKAGGPRK